ncbi:hypothetical protein NPIL_563801 [Nephila pilipes]|uniref:Uncharacterized protein n=1 Tax=Nephila pilipes TaxID=299642 RepID=A0A8X6PI72_NEPPI|nr:hypothetical protein NPIL_563801 [Nephila pilipes]
MPASGDGLAVVTVRRAIAGEGGKEDAPKIGTYLKKVVETLRREETGMGRDDRERGGSGWYDVMARCAVPRKTQSHCASAFGGRNRYEIIWLKLVVMETD